ncbi:RNA-binding protein MEX3B [Galendromus occidentalis]|uniref:RNA-binding protein MEX3B n=1 Tax=Galendromus occidentalis TaxID=34638 RepID=A0AAJ6QR61_9ACAR|nr:RNA-binding protein MEX3B [Galendromus occidentalis]
MPAALFVDMDRSPEDQVFQLAFELSRLGLQPASPDATATSPTTTTSSNSVSSSITSAITPSSQLGDLHSFGQTQISPCNGGGSGGSTDLVVVDGRTQKKSQNTTECVPVPSSEHVAEIVGRQGCKIKALRAKTNTYIKTPVRGEEPVFVVTGRKEDVNAAKKEILSAAEHFSSIRAQRKTNGLNSMAPGPNSNMPGQTTIHVRVPYRVVGLVVGPKGATIKRIQQQTNTYIVTPSREKEPVFEVTGLPDNVETARKEIEAHIAMRTGGSLHDHGSIGSGTDDDLSFGGPATGAHSLKALDSLGMQDTVFGPWSALVSQQQQQQQQSRDSAPAIGSAFPFHSKLYPAMNMSFLEEENPFTDSHGPVWPDFTGGQTGGRLTTSSGSQSSTEGSLDCFRYGPVGDRVSPTDSLGSAGRGPGAKIASTVTRECVVCFESEVVAALVPCGHNLFCLECANRLVASSKPLCPVCEKHCTQAVRIRN